ncbi:MAG: four helix bundle protein [Flavobacteriales bacterium]|nr:MAG: four helix bundle protein [Flavobacteriales bacterium]
MSSRSPYNKDNVILNLTFEFSLGIMDYTTLLDEGKKFVFAKQVLRSGTSIGANVKEAQNAESKADFIHKLKIAAKEADETEYWLQLCKQHSGYPNPVGLLDKLESINKVLNKIISTSKKKTANHRIN